ncbi:hypothetical protein BDN70DRAFT_993463 [Pholiota conissans]|uniref:Pyridoxamine 5'-phosphate oxidase Alr4036 family FMN-binding domain-containing protein n=1 Tax=Pholiota conissans TaxID=109636 RepID=A0A9P5Z3H1_9AGAR|nr:hypothetical protein BDN70DRAFT_993463 [Pholiota conissans]
MSSTVPRWKSAIEEGLAKFPNQTVVQIATLEQNISGGIIPRVRSHVVRSFLTNPTTPGLSLIVSTTDTRTPKVHQLTLDAHVEATWWLEGKKQQFRLAGKAYVFPAPSHTILCAHFKAALKDAPSGSALAEFREFGWEEGRLRTFRALSPGMRASWARPTPPPGSLLKDGTEEWPKKLEEPKEGQEGYEKAKELWDLALSRFSLVVIDPDEVDLVDLATDPDTRTRFTKKEGAVGVWEETALVP